MPRHPRRHHRRHLFAEGEVLGAEGRDRRHVEERSEEDQLVEPARLLPVAAKKHSRPGRSRKPRHRRHRNRSLASACLVRHHKRSPGGGAARETSAEVRKLSRREVAAVGDHGGDLAGVGDVIERIGASNTRSAIRPGCDRAEVIRSCPNSCAGLSVAVCSASSGVKPAATKRSSSWCRLMPGSTSTPAGVSVPARNGTLRRVQLSHEVELVRHEFLAHRPAGRCRAT